MGLLNRAMRVFVICLGILPIIPSSYGEQADDQLSWYSKWYQSASSFIATNYDIVKEQTGNAIAKIGASVKYLYDKSGDYVSDQLHEYNTSKENKQLLSQQQDLVQQQADLNKQIALLTENKNDSDNAKKLSQLEEKKAKNQKTSENLELSMETNANTIQKDIYYELYLR